MDKKPSAVREKQAASGHVKREYVTWDRVEDGFEILIKQMKRAKFRPKVIAGIQRGGLPLAVMLSHYYDVPFYLASRETQLVGKDMLLVDDVSDDGVTLTKYVKHLPKGVKTACLYRKSHTMHKPDFCAFVSDEWIVFPWEKSEPKRKKARRLFGIF